MSERETKAGESPRIDVRPFDVFLSYNGAHDRDAVERCAVELKRTRLEPWFDRWVLTPGRDWQQEIATGLTDSSACAVFVGADGLGPWEQQELAVALDRAAKDPSFRLFLVLLPGLPEPFDATTLPPFLSTRTWVDLRAGFHKGFQPLINAVKGIPDTRPSIRVSTDVCPYRGLQAFDEEHAGFFFGRDSDIQRLVEKLKASRFLAVLGPSGSGKSSLARAGLVPALRKGAAPGSDTWTILIIKPGNSPLTTLAAHLTQLSPGEGMAKTLDRMVEDPRTLHLSTSLALAANPDASNVLWVVDQFEEVFTLCADDRAREMFLANLLYAGSVPDGQTTVVLALRADFYAKCAAYPEFSTRIAAHQFLVSPLENDSLRKAVEEPARLVGLEFERGLVETILQDVADRPGALPLLEHALLELWERRRGKMLTLEGYRESGGVQGAIAKRAEAVFGSFAKAQQVIARRLLLRLTQPGEGTEDTRRRAAIEELITQPVEGSAVEEVVRAMSDARLLTASRDERTGQQFVDISHEALIRSWPRLRGWIDEDRAGLRVLRRITEAAQDWQKSNWEEDILYRGTRLSEALEWEAKNQGVLNPVERSFLSASGALQEQVKAEAEHRRQKDIEHAQQLAVARRRARRLYKWVAIVLVIGLLGTALAFVQKRAADRSRRVALADELATAALAADDPKLAVLLAAEAVDLARTGPAEDSLRRTLAGDHLRRSINVTGPGVEPVFVRSAAFSPDGKLIVTGDDSGDVVVWDVTQNPPVVVTMLVGHTGPISSVAFSPRDPNRVVSSSEDDSAILWDVVSGKPLQIWPHDSNVYDAEFSADGQRVVTAGDDRRVRVWSINSSAPLATLKQQNATLWCAAFDPQNDNLLVFGGGSNTAVAWDWSANLVTMTFVSHTDSVRSVAFSPDGSHLLTASADGTARVWDVESGESTVSMLGHTGGVFDAALSPDGRLVATASGDETVRLWDSVSGRELEVLRGHRAKVRSVAFSPDGGSILSASEEGKAFFWAVSAGEESLDHSDGVLSAAFSPDGRLVATSSSGGTTSVWDYRLGRTVAVMYPPIESRARYVAFSPDGRLLVTTYAPLQVGAAAGGPVPPIVWSLTTGQEEALPLRSGGQTVNRATFSPDGLFLLTASEDGVARIWELASGRLVVQLGPVAPMRDAEFSPDGLHIVTASADGTVRIWDAAGQGQPLVLSGHTDAVESAVFDPTGARLVTAGADGTAVVWDAGSGTQLLALSGHQGGVYSAAFSPDGKLIVTAGKDHTTRVWNAATGQPVSVLRGQTKAVNSAAFGPFDPARLDQLYLVTASADGTAHVYPWEAFAPIDELMGIVSSRVGRELTAEERRAYLDRS